MTRPRYHVTDAQALERYRLRLTFEDRTEATVDLADLVARGGVYRPLKDPDYFNRARLDTDAGTVVWPNDVDMAPEELYARARKVESSDSNLTAMPLDDHGRPRTPHRAKRARLYWRGTSTDDAGRWVRGL